MWKILQHNKPDDFILATNKATVLKIFRDLYEKCIQNTNLLWIKKQKITKLLKNGKTIVRINKKYFRLK